MSLASPSRHPQTPLSIRNGLRTPGTSLAKTPGNNPNPYRLLYRGALSLPGSHILLDGLAFVAKLQSPNKHGTPSLLENPLALALESMRGRPSLRFQGEVKLADVYLDESGSVEMCVTFCLIDNVNELFLQGHSPQSSHFSYLLREHLLSPTLFPQRSKCKRKQFSKIGCRNQNLFR